MASEMLDLLSAGFIAVGMEKIAVRQMDFDQGLRILVPGSVPWSHGLFMSLVWSVIIGAMAFLVYRDRWTSGMLGLVVFSHWALDFIVHPPDLQLFLKGSPEVGLGLWASGPGFIASLILELALLAGGIAIYRITRKQRAVQRQKKSTL